MSSSTDREPEQAQGLVPAAPAAAPAWLVQPEHHRQSPVVFAFGCSLLAHFALALLPAMQASAPQSAAVAPIGLRAAAAPMALHIVLQPATASHDSALIAQGAATRVASEVVDRETALAEPGLAEPGLAEPALAEPALALAALAQQPVARAERRAAGAKEPQVAAPAKPFLAAPSRPPVAAQAASPGTAARPANAASVAATVAGSQDVVDPFAGDVSPIPDEREIRAWLATMARAATEARPDAGAPQPVQNVANAPGSPPAVAPPRLAPRKLFGMVPVTLGGSAGARGLSEGTDRRPAMPLMGPMPMPMPMPIPMSANTTAECERDTGQPANEGIHDCSP